MVACNRLFLFKDCSVKDTTLTHRKIAIISRSAGLIFSFSKGSFAGLNFGVVYFRRGLLLEGILRFKMGWA